MGTNVDAIFGHAGDPAQVLEITRRLVEVHGFQLQEDALGHPELTMQSMNSRWNHSSIVHRHLLLKSARCLLWLYPRGANLHHGDVRWWAFASNGRMDSGLGREEVRSRSRKMAGLFSSDRILYAPDSIGVNRLSDGVGIEEEEAFLSSLRPRIGITTFKIPACT